MDGSPDHHLNPEILLLVALQETPTESNQSSEAREAIGNNRVSSPENPKAHNTAPYAPGSLP